MKSLISTAREKFLCVSSYVHTKANLFAYHNASKILFFVGVGLLTLGLTQIAHAKDWDNEILGALGRVFAIIEGSFGALIMVVSGLAAIIAAAMGAYRAAMGCLVVAVGAFILRSMVKLFFKDTVDDLNSMERGEDLEGIDN